MERLNLRIRPKPSLAASNTVNKMEGVYDPKDDLCASTRPGANDALRLPSRIGNKLFYPNKSIGEVK